jgi:hypothetical protein
MQPLREYLDSLRGEFDQIPAERKELLSKLTAYIQAKVDASEPIALTFICTHNSRRSHLSQLWAQTAAYYYGIAQVETYSGGTEATAFNPRAVKAVEKAGFGIEKTGEEGNPLYLVRFSPDQSPVKAFSKVYDQEGNPQTGFGAVMTCTHAEENCLSFRVPPAFHCHLTIPRLLMVLRWRKLSTRNARGKSAARSSTPLVRLSPAQPDEFAGIR